MSKDSLVDLKQWLCSEELRLAMRCDVLLADCMIHRTPTAAVAYFEAVIAYKQFMRFMRSCDQILHLFP